MARTAGSCVAVVGTRSSNRSPRRPSWVRPLDSTICVVRSFVPGALGPRAAAVHPAVPPAGGWHDPVPWCTGTPLNLGRIPDTTPDRNVAHPTVIRAAGVRLPGPDRWYWLARDERQFRPRAVLPRPRGGRGRRHPGRRPGLRSGGRLLPDLRGGTGLGERPGTGARHRPQHLAPRRRAVD